MDESIDYENIFTPQGLLGQVSKNPNLDFLMNICNIPQVYTGRHGILDPSAQEECNKSSAWCTRDDGHWVQATVPG